MRIRLAITTVALLVAAARMATAQDASSTAQPPVQQAKAPGASPGFESLGFFDLGARGNDNTGDYARYERYRDLRNGTYTLFGIAKQTSRYLFEASASNIGYHDQRYFATYSGGAARVNVNWISTPLNYTYLSSTPWTETSPGIFALDAAARLAVQNRTAIGVPSTAAQLLLPSVYRGLAAGFDLQSRRDAANVSVAYDASNEVGFNATFATTKRTGYQPWGASFAFNNANELALPLDNRTNDLAANLEWSAPKGMVRVGWNSSFFNNNLHELVWDNPLRATDTVPYDPSGYSNGNGPAQGRMSLAPSNQLHTISGTALYKMPAHTTINGTLSFTAMRQNDALIPWTINPAIANAGVYASFQGLAALPRSTAEASVHGVNGLVNFTTRPNRFFGLTARYRFNDHRNLTPEFDAVEYVRFDAVPEETGGVTEPFDIRQNTADVTASFNVFKYTALRIGYGYDAYNRTGRAFADMRDNTLRASLDTIGSRLVTVRGIYEYTKRRGTGFDQTVITDGGAQPDLRFFDDAERSRNKGTVVFTMNPVDTFDVTFSLAAGKDDYTNLQFGLLDNSNTSYNVGVNVFPARVLSLGANYGRDRYVADQRSRNANPPPDLQFADPLRDWTLANEENVNNVNLYLDLPKVIRSTDVRINYDYSDSDNGFIFGGPRIDSLTAAGQFMPLPDVTNKWQRLSVDVKYYFHKQVGIAAGYWYEKFEVNDFNTIDLTPGTPRIDNLGEISTGYGNRPYKGSTGFVRMIYLF
jgi:MtrB/PioB family decaheme-associated outer membrane protein